MRALSSQHLHGFWRFPREPRVYIKGRICLATSHTIAADDLLWISPYKDEVVVFTASEMETICLTLLLIVAAIGTDGLQPMKAYHSTADQHYHETDESTSIESQQTIGCRWEPGHQLMMCWVDGCNPSVNPHHFCFRNIFCDHDHGFCERHRDCLLEMPCYGPCFTG